MIVMDHRLKENIFEQCTDGMVGTIQAELFLVDHC